MTPEPDAPTLRAAVDAVLALHAPSDFPERTQFVASSHLSTTSHVCRACDPMDEYPVAYPCPTVLAITETLGEGNTLTPPDKEPILHVGDVIVIDGYAGIHLTGTITHIHTDDNGNQQATLTTRDTP